jgi:hypothetical protein
MQLSQTLFGVLVVQIKPQLEKVLNLPHDSLAKVSSPVFLLISFLSLFFNAFF